MKMIEITYRSNMNELTKLNERLARAEKNYEKKLAIAEKLGVATMTNEEFAEWISNVPQENGWIINKEDIKKNGARIDLRMAKNDLDEIKDRIEKAEARFEKVAKELDDYHKRLDEINDLKKKEELFKIEFEAEQKEWAKDGITLESRYAGLTPNGKRFWIVGNNGWTMRSLHCYTLTIGGETIFTSGEFWRAYAVIKNS